MLFIIPIMPPRSAPSQTIARSSLFIKFSLMELPTASVMRPLTFGMSPGVNGKNSIIIGIILYILHKTKMAELVVPRSMPLLIFPLLSIYNV